jgi:hypothetical protein
MKIHRTIIFSVILNECKMWSFTLREKRGLRVFENRMLRGMFDSRRGEVTRE